MLEAFASFLQRTGYDGRSLGLKVVITTSEVLSAPQRRLLEATFGVPVQNEYGCGEVGPIAYECDSGQLHVMSDNLRIELLQADGRLAGPGESGEVVITDLNNRAMPLVRYRVGDFATWGSSCSCGRSFPVLEKVWGRAYEFVQLPSGRRCHGEFFMYLFEDLRANGVDIEQFQVVQSAERRLDVSIVVKAALAEQQVDSRVQMVLEQRVPEMEVSVRRVSAIERAPSGKMRVILNPWLNPDAGGQQVVSAVPPPAPTSPAT
jgi:phenylacetate-CoA ligase